jgi:hypothetical protein
VAILTFPFLLLCFSYYKWQWYNKNGTLNVLEGEFFSLSVIAMVSSSSDPVLHGKMLVQIRGGCYRATPRHQSQQNTQFQTFSIGDPLFLNFVENSLERV